MSLRFTREVLGGTWEALQDGRADLVIGATNEPPALAGLQWFELGTMAWTFAVSPRHPLARAPEPLTREVIAAHRAVVVADSSRRGSGRTYGVAASQATLAVPGMQAKILAQCEGLGVGWLPSGRIRRLLERGALVSKAVVEPREPNVLYVAWRGEGRALDWWLEKLRGRRLAQRLIRGVEAA